MLPDVAPIAELGVPGFDAASWQMVVAPAATPKEIVERLHGEIKDFMAQREVRAQIAKHGMLPIDTPSVAGLQDLRQIGNCAMGQAGRASRRRRHAVTRMRREPAR